MLKQQSKENSQWHSKLQPRGPTVGLQINDFTLPDIDLIGEQSDAAELGRMLQLILYCAVNCKQKQKFIHTIRLMEESVQHVAMIAIQELMSNSRGR